MRSHRRRSPSSDNDGNFVCANYNSETPFSRPMANGECKHAGNNARAWSVERDSLLRTYVTSNHGRREASIRKFFRRRFVTALLYVFEARNLPDILTGFSLFLARARSRPDISRINSKQLSRLPRARAHTRVLRRYYENEVGRLP